MALSDYIYTLGQQLLLQHGERIHKIALDVGFTCPNRDGSKGIGGCTFCNNNSFSPNQHQPKHIEQQLDSGRRAIAKRTRAKKFLAYFQAYTNTYDTIQNLKRLYDSALQHHDIVGLSIGTRPDCVPDAVLDLLQHYQNQGHIVWLELGLQSAFDATLAKVNRGHGLAEYQDTARRARLRNIPLCTHLILGLPDETVQHYQQTLDIVLDIGTDGLKLHPLHVVRHTLLAKQWKQGNYHPLTQQAYIEAAAELIARTPGDICYHRITGTASRDILLTPAWCSQKWAILNGIEQVLVQREQKQGYFTKQPYFKPQSHSGAIAGSANPPVIPHQNDMREYV